MWIGRFGRHFRSWGRYSVKRRTIQDRNDASPCTLGNLKRDIVSCPCYSFAQRFIGFRQPYTSLVILCFPYVYGDELTPLSSYVRCLTGNIYSARARGGEGLCDSRVVAYRLHARILRNTTNSSLLPHIPTKGLISVITNNMKKITKS